jgi:cobalamin biosynthesis protein CobT
MPPPPKGAPNNNKKKKGPAPAHQNKFAFRHNPKSKLTEKILTSPNVHVCQRCHDKIEWRKQYRKYKPRTQPGTCNGCGKRNVLSAYHTICTACTQESAKAKEIIEKQRAGENENQEEEKKSIPSNFMRACAVCVKEVALPDPDDEATADDDALASGVGRIRLREQKALERKLAKEAEANKMKRRDTEDDDDNSEENDEDDDDQSEENADDDSGNESGDNSGNLFGGTNQLTFSSLDDEADPFLQAIGGADQLLVGEAYQQKLLERLEKQRQQSGLATGSEN